MLLLKSLACIFKTLFDTEIHHMFELSLFESRQNAPNKGLDLVKNCSSEEWTKEKTFIYFFIIGENFS